MPWRRLAVAVAVLAAIGCPLREIIALLAGLIVGVVVLALIAGAILLAVVAKVLSFGEPGGIE